MRLALNEEKFRANNPSYADHTNTALGVTNTSYYTFTIVAAANTYTITATAAGSQTNDTGCTPLTLTEGGAKGPAGCWKS
ncbi:MAG: type IV pilin protein [Rhodoferax sp.]|nr:type IV pilin protein [Rhodoferax sp.]